MTYAPTKTGSIYNKYLVLKWYRQCLKWAQRDLEMVMVFINDHKNGVHSNYQNALVYHDDRQTAIKRWNERIMWVRKEMVMLLTPDEGATKATNE